MRSRRKYKIPETEQDPAKKRTSSETQASRLFFYSTDINLRCEAGVDLIILSPARAEL